MPHIKTSQTNRLSKTFLDTKSQKCGLRCTVFSVDGNEYTGEWLNNKKHGKGTQVWKKSGAIYTGEWKFGKRDGYGTLSVLLPETKEYEKKYCGGWENGKKHGFGLQFYKNAAVYEGGWIEGQRGVWGRMCYESGDVYEGEWLMDKTHGQGTIRFGQILEGFWVDGVAKCGTLSDFQRSEAPTPTKYSIPQLQLMDMDLVLSEAKSAYLETLSSKFPLARDKLAKKE
ncbi:MORN repeat-containing protein 3 isoform X2 [Gasterosteus aculeatus]|uniref:MORN repeat-containing protein 3 isoform X2 n=1 Tax=Gasterosteus aculeatus aculeatus TaxID=481459 RepID=UPI001A9A157D|nr:MORN repeat-containing protein 3 isoform X2 [Gasterosteus aculeatus aculeatus]